MSDLMQVQPFERLLDWILGEYETRQSIFGIHESLFYRSRPDSPYAGEMFGHRLATPIGPAAGPHTQLTQNILCAWLSGGRFIELKTVQIMDELEIPRPCIDMEDEGYNVEWSQELKLEQSLSEYVKAWVLIHVLRRLLGFEGQTPFGTIFNMSVGYNLEGIQSPAITRFMDRLADAADEIGRWQDVLRRNYPRFGDIDIPTQLTNNVTLSTMHGCPPDEIEQIALYLLTQRKLHTTVKLNPTLLGKERVRNILHDSLGFDDIDIPDAVFEHDLQYGRALKLIHTLQAAAEQENLRFAAKLSNTLAMANHKDVLPGAEMYMSGRALYPITMNLFQQLSADLDGTLHVSYSAGADALNVATILSTGARPVTVASDLLKPGGYSRLKQYLENLETEMIARGAKNLDELAQDPQNALAQAAEEALENPRYKKSYHPFGLPKVASGLDLFDCIDAPCVEQCAVRQDVPDYAWLIAQGDYDEALRAILTRNPLPGITGYVCTHLCQTRCTRNNYDEPVAIRALKRFAVENGAVSMPQVPKREQRVAVIGSGPAGLAAATFLALNGVQVTILEAKDRAGGMPAIAPAFRLPPEVVQADVERVKELGVEILLSHPFSDRPETLLEQGFDAVYLGSGFPNDARLSIEGLSNQGVYSALDLLERVANGEKPALGERVLVIGGGNTAMDAARTAQRLTGRPVTVVYRRTLNEMPATDEEKEALFAEGNVLEPLATPVRILAENGRVVGLECLHNELGEPGRDGRRKPIPVEGSEFRLPADSVIYAIGQAADTGYLEDSTVALAKNGAVRVEPESGRAANCVYAGGDLVRGPAIIIEACADGRRAAEAICKQLNIDFEPLAAPRPALTAQDIIEVKQVRARKQAQVRAATLPPAERNTFVLVEQTLTEDEARNEAGRCMQCATLCDKCIEVCPNRANASYQTNPVSLTVSRLACLDGRLVEVAQESFVVSQTRQIVHIDDLCNECGNCATFCVHTDKPYRDKPRLFLERALFEQEEENAFFIEGNTLWRRQGGRSLQLTWENGEVTYEDSALRLHLTDSLDIRQSVLKQEFADEFSLRTVAEMLVLLKGLRSSLPFLAA